MYCHWGNNEKNEATFHQCMEDIDNVDWSSFSLTNLPEAIEYLREHPDKIDWNYLSMNSDDLAVNLLMEHPDKIDWKQFSTNTNDKAIEYLTENTHLIDKDMLMYNRNLKMIDIIKKDPKSFKGHLCKLIGICNEFDIHNELVNIMCDLPRDEIDWDYMSKIGHLKAIEFLKNNQDMIQWKYLSANIHDKAIEILKENQDKIDWSELSFSRNGNAIDLLSQNFDKIDWKALMHNLNPKAQALLMDNIDKVSLTELTHAYLPSNKFYKLVVAKYNEYHGIDTGLFDIMSSFNIDTPMIEGSSNILISDVSSEKPSLKRLEASSYNNSTDIIIIP